MGLSDLARLGEGRSRRVSSFDRSGGNRDWWDLAPGETRAIAQIEGPGVIRHIWMTVGGEEPAWPRRIVLRMHWDGEEHPSVEAPIGDFFGMGHGMLKDYVSAPLQMSPSGGRGMNCWFPMPFARSARIEVANEGQEPHPVYFYVDYEALNALDPELACFHAQWRRQNPTDGWADPSLREAFQKDVWSLWDDPRALNTTGEGNYVILEAEGRGHYVGCNLHVDVFERQVNDWFGEGDDMIFVDGELALHGTGTEDYFCTAYGPRTEQCAPYHGILLYSGTPEWPWGGRSSLYRYHIEDPIRFRRSIRVTIEHGHGNKLTCDYSSTAYWYQTEPHRPFPPLAPVSARLPRRLG